MKKKPNSTFVLSALPAVLLIAGPVPAFFNDIVASNGYSGTLGAGAASAKYRLSSPHNPAALKAGHCGFSLSHYSPFQISEIKVSETGVFWDWQRWGVSITGLQTSVTEEYLEHTLSAHVSVIPYQPLTAGLGLDLRRLEIHGYGSAFYPGESMGMVLNLWNKFFLGFFVSDIISQLISKEELYPIYQAGLSVRAPSGYSLDFDIRRDHSRNWRHYFSQTLIIRRVLEISVGIADRPYQFSIGASVHFKGFGIFHAAQMHQNLGRTHHYGLQKIFSRKK